jgi:hypothetical protein
MATRFSSGDRREAASEPGLEPCEAASEPGLEPCEAASEPGLEPCEAASEPGLEPGGRETDAKVPSRRRAPSKGLTQIARNVGAFVREHWDRIHAEAERLGGEPEIEIRINRPSEHAVRSLLAWLEEHGAEDPDACIVDAPPTGSIKVSSGTTVRTRGAAWETKAGVVKWFQDYRLAASVEHPCDAPKSLAGIAWRDRSRKAFCLPGTNSSMTPDGRAVVWVMVTRVETSRPNAKNAARRRETEVEIELSREVRSPEFAAVALSNVLEAVMAAMRP